MPPTFFIVFSQLGFKMNANHREIVRLLIPQNSPQSHYSKIFWWSTWKRLIKKKIQRVSHTYSCLLWHSSTLPSCSQSYIGIFSSFSLECKRLFPLILTLDMGMKRAWYIDLQEVKQIVPIPTRNKTVLSSASSLRAGSPRPSFPPQQDYTFL